MQGGDRLMRKPWSVLTTVMTRKVMWIVWAVFVLLSVGFVLGHVVDPNSNDKPEVEYVDMQYVESWITGSEARRLDTWRYNIDVVCPPVQLKEVAGITFRCWVEDGTAYSFENRRLVEVQVEGFGLYSYRDYAAR